MADALEGSPEVALSEDRKRVRRAAELKPSDEVRARLVAVLPDSAPAGRCWPPNRPLTVSPPENCPSRSGAPPSPQVVKDVDARSLYASPFPFDASLDAITSYFEAAAPGGVRSVRLRRILATKDFRGSVFVEFGSVEEAEKARWARCVTLRALCDAVRCCACCVVLESRPGRPAAADSRCLPLCAPPSRSPSVPPAGQGRGSHLRGRTPHL